MERRKARFLSMATGQQGCSLNLFVCVVYPALICSKHKSKSLFQNLVANIAEGQILRGMVLLGGDFNARTTVLPNTIDTSDLCEML